MDNIEREKGCKRKRVTKKAKKIKESRKNREENNSTLEETETGSQVSNDRTSIEPAKVTWAKLINRVHRGVEQSSDDSKIRSARAHISGNHGKPNRNNMGISCKSGFFQSLRPVKANGKSKTIKTGDQGELNTSIIKNKSISTKKDYRCRSKPSNQKLISSYFSVLQPGATNITSEEK